MFDNGRVGRRPGKTWGPPLVSRVACSRISTQCDASGTRCSRQAFIRVLGIVRVRATTSDTGACMRAALPLAPCISP